MKKKLISLSTLIAFVLLFFTGCQKEIQQKEKTPLAGENSLQASANNDDNTGCQLKQIDFGGGVTYDFKYNNKGLASELLINFGDGLPDLHKMSYDKKSKLIKDKLFSAYYNVVIDYTFFYIDNLVTRVTGYYEGTNNIWVDIFYTYNRKDQMTKAYEVTQDLLEKYYYNNQGFNSRGEMYIGGDLIFTYDYGFRIPNKNPYLAVNGVPYGFFNYLPYWDKRWETYDRLVTYENGSPTVIVETDPYRTTMTTGPHNYLISDTKYDLISESFYTESMTYQNCGGGHDDVAAPASKQFKPSPNGVLAGRALSPVAKLQRILSGTSKNIKQQLKELKRELKK